MGPVDRAVQNGKDVLFDVDWQGGQQIRNSTLGKHVLTCLFLLPPSIRELLERRLVSRQQDVRDVIEKSIMAESRDEISHWPEL